MPENILILMMGLPRSGKSTIAQTFKSPIVNPDSIRLALHGKAFEKLAEPFVWAIAQVMVRALFLAGHTQVILDATNTTRKRRKMWDSDAWNTYVYFVDTPKDECIERAKRCHFPVEVVERMADQFEPLEEGEVEYND